MGVKIGLWTVECYVQRNVAQCRCSCGAVRLIHRNRLNSAMPFDCGHSLIPVEEQKTPAALRREQLAQERAAGVLALRFAFLCGVSLSHERIADPLLIGRHLLSTDAGREHITEYPYWVPAPPEEYNRIDIMHDDLGVHWKPVEHLIRPVGATWVMDRKDDQLILRCMCGVQFRRPVKWIGQMHAHTCGNCHPVDTVIGRHPAGRWCYLSDYAADVRLPAVSAATRRSVATRCKPLPLVSHSSPARGVRGSHGDAGRVDGSE